MFELSDTLELFSCCYELCLFIITQWENNSKTLDDNYFKNNFHCLWNSYHHLKAKIVWSLKLSYSVWYKYKKYKSKFESKFKYKFKYKFKCKFKFKYTLYSLFEKRS